MNDLNNNKNILQDVKGYIFDIDGTLAALDPKTRVFTPLPGALELLQLLTDKNIPYLFFTNGTLHTFDEYVARMNKIGLTINQSMMLTPVSVGIDTMKRARVKRVLVLGAEGSRVPLSNAGFDVILPEMGESEYERVDAVFLGWFPDFCLADMTAASKAIWAGARLYVVSNARTYATSKGPALGISGMLAAGLKNTTNKTAKLVGKPSKIAFKYASNLLKVPGENIAVVGDDCTLEPQFAHAGGGIGIGVETGLSTRDQFLNMPEKVRPQLIIRDLTKLLSYLA